jgi:hypothetical protein
MNTLELQGKQYTVTVEGSRLILDEIKPEAKGLWKPAKGGTYYYVPNLSEGIESTSRTARCDESVIARGNCFPSASAAEKASPLMARANKIIAAALQADPDAGEWSERRANTATQTTLGVWTACSFGSTFHHGAYVHTPEQAEEMRRILNTEGVK